MNTRSSVCAVLICLVSGLVSCSSGRERSQAAFCQTFIDNAIQLHNKYEAAAANANANADTVNGLLGSLGTVFQAEGDLVTLFSRLASVAPSDISPDVETVRDSLKSQEDATRKIASNPLGALGEGLIAGLQSGGSMDRVNAYTNAHCDLTQLKTVNGA